MSSRKERRSKRRSKTNDSKNKMTNDSRLQCTGRITVTTNADDTYDADFQKLMARMRSSCFKYNDDAFRETNPNRVVFGRETGSSEEDTDEVREKTPPEQKSPSSLQFPTKLAQHPGQTSSLQKPARIASVGTTECSDRTPKSQKSHLEPSQSFTFDKTLEIQRLSKCPPAKNQKLSESTDTCTDKTLAADKTPRSSFPTEKISLKNPNPSLLREQDEFLMRLRRIEALNDRSAPTLTEKDRTMLQDQSPMSSPVMSFKDWLKLDQSFSQRTSSVGDSSASTDTDKMEEYAKVEQSNNDINDFYS